MKIAFFVFLFASANGVFAAPFPPSTSKGKTEPKATTLAQHDTRMAWWREARFGMFIHWGLYAEAGGVWEGRAVPGLGEWLMHRERVPVAGYAALARRFQPAGFDAAVWVRAAREAGMKYIVITAKHHDGFAMFRSKASAFNIYDATPFHRDPLKELAAECKKQGMKLGFFYSQAQDWHHAGGATFGEHWDKAQKTPFSPPSGPATGSFNGLHRESNFLAIISIWRWRPGSPPVVSPWPPHSP